MSSLLDWLDLLLRLSHIQHKPLGLVLVDEESFLWKHRRKRISIHDLSHSHLLLQDLPELQLDEACVEPFPSSLVVDIHEQD